MNQQQERQRYQNKVNNAQGHFFEKAIAAGCEIYRDRERAEIDKIPEPFRVTKKGAEGKFSGRFTASAQPDFQGTLASGRSIVFEAKYTTTDRIKRDALTDAQIDSLHRHARLGAASFVCVGINDRFFMVPWAVWRDMKLHYGRLYATADNLEIFRVKFTGAVMFLDYVHEKQNSTSGSGKENAT